jgi:hypothetical protein
VKIIRNYHYGPISQKIPNGIFFLMIHFGKPSNIPSMVYQTLEVWKKKSQKNVLE